MSRRIVIAVAAVTIPVLIAAGAFAVRGTRAPAAHAKDAMKGQAAPAAQPAADPAQPSGADEPIGATTVRNPVAPLSDLDSIDYPLTRADLDRLEAAVDDGHQPWRFDPVAVAEAYLRAELRVEPVMGEYRPWDRFSGEVPYHAAPRASACGCADIIPPENEYLEGAVLVRRLEGPGSVFLVVGQRSERLSVTSKLRGSILTVDITADAAGDVYATAESLRGGDAMAHDSADVEAGQRATLKLQLAGIRAPVLVRVVHSGRDSVATITEFRADRIA